MSHLLRNRKEREGKASAAAASSILPAEFEEIESYPPRQDVGGSGASAGSSPQERLSRVLKEEQEKQQSLYAASPHSSIDKAAAKARRRARSYTDPAKVLVVVLILGFLVWVFPTISFFVRSNSKDVHDNTCHICAAAHHRETMPWQKEFALASRGKGCHLVTSEVTSQISEGLKDVQVGILTLFIKHTSASLSLNENYDPTVRTDMTRALVCNVDVMPGLIC